MDSILRAVAVYVLILVLVRISGNRTLSQITTFDFVLLLVIAETTQQALTGDDYSITNLAILSGTLVALTIALSFVTYHVPGAARWIEGAPLILVREGRVLRDRLRKERVTEEEILEAAREKHGLERLDQVKYAVLEISGDITIIPAE